MRNRSSYCGLAKGFNLAVRFPVWCSEEWEFNFFKSQRWVSAAASSDIWVLTNATTFLTERPRVHFYKLGKKEKKNQVLPIARTSCRLTAVLLVSPSSSSPLSSSPSSSSPSSSSPSSSSPSQSPASQALHSMFDLVQYSLDLESAIASQSIESRLSGPPIQDIVFNQGHHRAWEDAFTLVALKHRCLHVCRHKIYLMGSPNKKTTHFQNIPNYILENCVKINIKASYSQIWIESINLSFEIQPVLHIFHHTQ